jgi:hypothetical protein
MNHAPITRTDLKEVGARHQQALASGTPSAILAALSDIPPLCEEIRHLRLLLSIARLTRANLAAAARATLAAAVDHEKDPLYYLHDELTAQGRLTASHQDMSW